MTDFTMKTDADGVATITWDVAGKSMNVMSTGGLSRCSAIWSTRRWPMTAVKGIIITSGKEGFRRRDGSERHRPDAGGRRAGDL